MKSVVICGGGIIGCSIAYYLSKLDPDFAKIIIVERNEIAGHASGKAGGFLGKYYTIDIQMTRAFNNTLTLHKYYWRFIVACSI